MSMETAASPETGRRFATAWTAPPRTESVIVRRLAKILLVFALLCVLANKLVNNTERQTFRAALSQAYALSMRGGPQHGLVAGGGMTEAGGGRELVLPGGWHLEAPATGDAAAAASSKAAAAAAAAASHRRFAGTVWRRVARGSAAYWAGGGMAPAPPAPCSSADEGSQVGDIVSVDYTSWTFDRGVRGSVVDTSSGPYGEKGWDPYTFKLGDPDGAVRGLDRSVRGMCAGERRVLVVPPPMAYGAHTLLFDVEMVAFAKGSAKKGGAKNGGGGGGAGVGGGVGGVGSGPPVSGGSDGHDKQLALESFCKQAPPPFCAALQRRACYMRMNTCGPCMPGHVGRMGYANTACIAAGAGGGAGGAAQQRPQAAAAARCDVVLCNALARGPCQAPKPTVCGPCKLGYVGVIGSSNTKCDVDPGP